MLTATNLVFKAGGRLLIDSISAIFEPGHLHLIIGPNGAGKSTLVKLLARLLQPYAGSVTYSEADAKHWNERELARHRAILSQAIEVAFPIPVRELVMMGRYPHFRGRPAAIDETICDDVMQYFDVTDLAKRDYATLSGGEQQRVNFARVLAQIWQPLEGSHRYLFLDEPLTFLDIRHQIDFMKKVREFATQPNVVVIGVVHDLNLATRFADNLILLHHGRILANGNTADVLTADNLQLAFDVKPAFITNPATGRRYLSYD
jgi:iron complex transport system ATP-binding protein